MQLKYSFKKESIHFFRTFRFIVIVLVTLSFAIGNPLMFKFCDVVLNSVDMGTGTSSTSGDSSVVSEVIPNEGESSQSTPTDIFGGVFAAISADTTDTANTTATADAADTTGEGDSLYEEDPMAALNSVMGGIGMDDILSVYSDAGMMFATTIATIPGSALLVIMLLIMPAAGGEQKKRAMIVPLSVGMSYKNYLIPKFVIYPLTTMALSFVSTLISGGLCNLMFANNKVSMEIMMLSAVMMAVYMGFAMCVYLAMGLCTSKPGIMTAVLFVSQSLLQSLLTGFGLTDYHPLALLNYTGGAMVVEGFVLEDHIVGISVSIGLSIVIAVGMYFLTLAVLGAKKINNQADIEPEF